MGASFLAQNAGKRSVTLVIWDFYPFIKQVGIGL
jgi:hypothetical protein